MKGSEVKYKLKQSGHSLIDISAQLGISPQNLQNKLRSKDVKFEFLQDLAKAINKTVYYFIGSGSKNVELIVEPNVEPFVKKGHISLVKDEGSVQYRKPNVLLVPIKAQAGYMAGYGDTEYIEQLEYYRLPECTNGNYRMFEIAGGSMVPTFSPGDYVVGRQETDCYAIKANTIYIIVDRAEGIIVKRVLNAPKTNGKLLLSSDNALFKQIEIDCSTIAEMWEFYMLLTTLPVPPDPTAARLKILEQEVADIRRILRKK